jgi:hypothetical protein
VLATISSILGWKNVAPSPDGRLTPSVSLSADFHVDLHDDHALGRHARRHPRMIPVWTSTTSCWDTLMPMEVPANRETVAPTLIDAGWLSSVVMVGG